ncbi:MAG: cysteine hydrolase [Chloroflexi bacterium]|nr:MAG: cysteine hydrolase [Chloroflexota bacterium]
MDAQTLIQESKPFLEWLVNWYNNLPTQELSAVITDPEHVAVLSVDVIKGFLYEGPLASPRVARIAQPIVRLFQRAYDLGVRHFILLQDTHDPEAVEFGSFPPHAVAGTPESETIPELQALPFADQFVRIAKNSISSNLNTRLPAWLDEHPEVTTFIVVGDVTDMCTYQLALYLRLRANAWQRKGDRVLLPVNCVETYDLPVEAAEKIGAYPHPGDLLHLIFLHSMAIHGVELFARFSDA